MSNILHQYQVALFGPSGAELTDFPRLSAFFHVVGGKLENRDAIGWADNPNRPELQVGSVRVLNVYVSTDGLHTETAFEHTFAPKFVGPHSSFRLAAGELAQA
jgi:hypothetical protein